MFIFACNKSLTAVDESDANAPFAAPRSSIVHVNVNVLQVDERCASHDGAAFESATAALEVEFSLQAKRNCSIIDVKIYNVRNFLLPYPSASFAAEPSVCVFSSECLPSSW